MSSLDGTNAGILASVADHMNRGDMTAVIPDFIVITEADLNRALRTRLMQAQVTATIASGTVTLPTDFAGVISIQNADGKPLNERDPDAFALLKYQDSTDTGSITDFAVFGGAFQFWPAPSTSVAVTMTYYQRIPPLASNTAGNWVSLRHPDVYVYGACAAAAAYLANASGVAAWGALYTRAVQSILGADRERYGSRLTPQPSAYSIV